MSPRTPWRARCAATAFDRSVAQQAGLLHANGHEVFAGRVVLWEWRRVGGVRTPVWATARLYQAGAAWDDAPKYLNVRGDRPLIGLEDLKRGAG